MNRRSYLPIFAGTAAGLLAAAALLSATVDPYGLFRPGDGSRAVLESRIGQLKLYQAIRRRVHGVVLGNSRADVGFDPRHDLFVSRGEVAHNLAVPGGGLDVSAAQLLALCQSVPLSTAVVGIDFMDFIRPRGKKETYSPPNPLRVSPLLKEYARAVLSAEAVFDSVRTVVALESATVSRQSPEGLNLMDAYESETRRIGYFPLFEQKLAEYARRLASAPREIMHSEESSPRLLVDIIETSRRCGTRLLIVTYPYHLQFLALINEAGLWGAFEDWKRLVAHEANRGGSNIVFWDVARASAVTCEAIPPRGDRVSVPQWYWEAGHFKRTLGDLILSSLLGDPVASRKLGAVRLTGANIEAVLAEDRKALGAALAAASDLRSEVKETWDRQSPPKSIAKP